MRGRTQTYNQDQFYKPTLTHAPCAGANVLHGAIEIAAATLTHAPCAGANMGEKGQTISNSYFNPRPLCGGEPFFDSSDDPQTLTLTHAPCAGANSRPEWSRNGRRYFNPRPLCGGEQQNCINCNRKFIYDSIKQPILLPLMRLNRKKKEDDAKIFNR